MRSDDQRVPQISEFHGIRIYMYWDDHGRPHFHAEYAEYEAKIEIGSGALLGGRLPRRMMRLVRKWESMHREELLRNWDRARARRTPLPVEPLP